MEAVLHELPTEPATTGTAKELRPSSSRHVRTDQSGFRLQNKSNGRIESVDSVKTMQNELMV